MCGADPSTSCIDRDVRLLERAEIPPPTIRRDLRFSDGYHRARESPGARRGVADAAVSTPSTRRAPQALDDALRLRQRGRARIDHACEMRELFDSYCNLAGPFADAEDASHRGAAYLIYCDAFRRLQERCRADAK